MTVAVQPPHGSHDSAEPDTVALRVLAAPSGTAVRFLLFALAAVSTSALVYAFGYLAVPRNFDFFHAVFVQCRPTLDSGESDAEASSAFSACTSPASLDMLAWVGWALAGQFLLVAVLYLLHPWWIRRRARLVDLGADAELRAELAGLAGRSGLRRTPRWLLAPYSYGPGGQAFGLPWRPAVQLDAGLLVLRQRDPARFRAVLLHELAHLRNRDVAITYLTVAVWWAYAGVALLPFLVLLALPTTDVGAASRAALLSAAVLLSALVYLARTAVLRIRERYADVAAAAAGTRAPVLAAIDALPWPPRPGRRGAWSARYGTHPSPQTRRETVRDPTLLLRTGPGEVVAFGLAVGIAMANFLHPVPLAVGFRLGFALVCLAAAVAIAVFLTAVARRADPGPVRLWGMPVLLALGVGAGSLLSVGAVFEDWSGSPARWLVSTVLLCLGVALWHVWFTSAHRATGSRAWAVRALVAAVALTGGIFLFFWLFNASGTALAQWLPGPPPRHGADIGWYRSIAQAFATTYQPIITLNALPLGSVLITFAALPILAGRVRCRFALVTGAVAGGVAVLAAAVLPLIARATLPVAVRQPVEPYELGGPATFDLVLLYGYAAVAAAGVVVVAVVIAFRSERMRPALVAAGTATAVVVAAPGLYVLKTSARCVDVYAEGKGCSLHWIAPADHTLLLDTILAWSVVVALPAALLAAAAGARWRRGRAPSVPSVAGRRPITALPTLAALLTLAAVAAFFAVTETPRLAALVLPDRADAARSGLDRCLAGFWVEESRQQVRPDSATTVTQFTSSGAVWSFTEAATATLYLGINVARPPAGGADVAYVSRGTMRWRVSAAGGFVGFTEPQVAATLTGEAGGLVRGTLTLGPDEAAGYALPAAYTCGGDALTAWTSGYQVVLRRIGGIPGFS